MGVSTFDVINTRVGPDLATAGLNMAAKRTTLTSASSSNDFSFDLPVGASLISLILFNPTAATGSPTNANLSIGKTLGGAEFVAAVDIKAAGKTALTFATTNLADAMNMPATAGITGVGGVSVARVYARIAFVGGSSPTVAPILIAEYAMPYTAPADGRGL
jgi:hypothetical protein